MKKNNSITQPIKGMARESFSHLLGEDVFTFQKNGNIQTDEQSVGLTNEHSNLLCSRFKPNFKVVGNKYDSLGKRVIFFLFNPITEVSEIGHIKFKYDMVDINDVSSSCGCDVEYLLSTPLEDIEQEELCTYETLVNDSCNRCLNFSLNSPIQDIVIRTEQTGTIMYWADGVNPYRYLNFDEIQDYSKRRDPCSSEDEDVCFDCEKLRVFNLFQRPVLEAKSVVGNGNLPLGTYEYKVAYSDIRGNELSSYFHTSGEVTLFDASNNVLEQKDLANNSGYSIKLSITELDNRFNYYKVVVIHRRGIGGTYTCKEFPVKSTSDNILVHSTLDKLKECSLEKVLTPKTVYDTVDGVVGVNNYLLAYGLTERRKWNLQPVVNLLGQHLKWQTVIADEDLYKDGTSDAKYRSYMRNEVYPFSIRFGDSTGYVSANFPLISRLPTEYDNEEVSNLDTESVISAEGCETNDRKKRWQFYNTAGVEQNADCFSGDMKGSVVVRNTEEFSLIPDVHVISGGVLELSPKGIFSDFKEWVELNSELIQDPGSDIYNPTLAEILSDVRDQVHVTPEFPFEICSGGDCGKFTCSPPELVEESQRLLVGDVILNGITRYDLPLGEYILSEVPRTSMSTKDGEPLDTNAFTYTIFPTNEDEKYVNGVKLEERVFLREGNYGNNTLQTAIDLTVGEDLDLIFNYSVQIDTFPSWIFTNYNIFPIEGETYLPIDASNNPYGCENLTSTVDAHIQTSEFRQSIHSNAAWYKFEFSDQESEMVLEVHKSVDNRRRDFVTADSTNIRYHIFNQSMDIVDFGIIDYTSGFVKKLTLDMVGTSSVFIVLDSPIIERSGITRFLGEFDGASGQDEARTTENLQYCVSTSPTQLLRVGLREVELERVVLDVDKISFNKEEKYTSLCKFFVPEIDNCRPLPYERGIFSYVESTEKYPDNRELFDSSSLVVDPLNYTSEQLQFFENFGRLDNKGKFIWYKDSDSKSLVDFTCRGIRHFKFPDNNVSPFMNTYAMGPFGKSVIHPIGVSLEEKHVELILDLAVDNGLLSREEREKITFYEIFRGDRTANKSIIYKGILSDMYKDPTQDNTYFRNFPYNSLGDNQLLLDNSSKTLKHPFGSESNNRFSLVSPEVYLTKPRPGNELVVDGIFYGHSVGGFKKVDEHAKWVILGSKADKLANKLATAEVVFETVLQITELLVNSSENFRFGGGFYFEMNPVGIVLSVVSIAAFSALTVANNIIFKRSKYYAQWIQTFKQLGDPKNFAQYFISEKGFYNSFSPTKLEGNWLRGIKKSVYLGSGIPTFNEGGEYIRINNRDRESSLYLSLGDFNYAYSQKYIRYDNVSMSPLNSSRFLSSDSGCDESTDKVKNIACPYVSLKNYVPDQYGTIDSITWIQTPHRGVLGSTSGCDTIFGGDIRISRVDLKSKFPLFYSDAVQLGDRIPFDYKDYPNVANSRFYCSYDTTTTGSGFLKSTPVQKSDYKFDCLEGDNKFYVRPQSKFYLYYYGVPYFLVESEINSNYRYAGLEPHEQFASNGIDVEKWTQEVENSIVHDNHFKYNLVYSQQGNNASYYTLPVDYRRDRFDKLVYSPNDVIYSNQDNNEQSFDNPWLVYKPFNRGHFRTDYGKLINLINIESSQVLALFENQASIFNAVDTLKDRLTVENSELGLGGMFRDRPAEFHKTELGETGTQHKAFVSTEFGHFWVDALRGKVNFVHPNGSGLRAISDYNASGKESGVSRWFKRNLPFKILGVEGLNYLNVDNAFNGPGIVSWWDSKFKRLFITKKDYIPKNDCLQWSEDLGFYINHNDCNGTEPDCPRGFIYNSDKKMCEQQQTTQDICQDGYEFNPNTNRCEKVVTVFSCPEGYTYNEDSGKCVSDSSSTSSIDELLFILDASSSLNIEELSQRNNLVNSIIQGFSSRIINEDVSISIIEYGKRAETLVHRSFDVNIANTVLRGDEQGRLGTSDYEISAWNEIYKLREQYENNNAALIFITDGWYYDKDFTEDESLDVLEVSQEFFDEYNNGGILDINSLTSITEDIQLMFDNRTLIMLGTERERSKTGKIYLDLPCDYPPASEYLWTAMGIPVFPTEGNGINGLKAYDSSFSEASQIVDDIVSDISVISEVDPELIIEVDSVSPDCEGVIEEGVCIFTTYVDPIYRNEVIDINNPDYFDDCSWTIAYSPVYDSWVSYYDFKPNYAVAHNGFFQTGLNNSKDIDEQGIWSHLLTNRSFQVFYGKKYPWTIEYPVKNIYVNKVLDMLSLRTRTYRYHNEIDFAEWRNNSFNWAVVYNNTNNSGLLSLEYTESLRGSKYPKNLNKITQKIPVTHYDSKITFNYFYNRVKKEDYHVSIWKNDCKSVDKFLNPDAISFKGKRVLERLRGEWFLVRLTQDKSSQFKQVFKWSENSSDLY